MAVWSLQHSLLHLQPLLFILLISLRLCCLFNLLLFFFLRLLLDSIIPCSTLACWCCRQCCWLSCTTTFSWLPLRGVSVVIPVQVVKLVLSVCLLLLLRLLLLIGPATASRGLIN